MTTVIPHSELVRKALEWIGRESRERGVPPKGIMDEAAQRFNLSPMDVEFLHKTLSDTPAPTIP